VAIQRSRPGTVTVSVQASDPVIRLGATSILGADQRLRLVEDGEPAEVLVVIERSLNDSVFARLRAAREQSPPESPSRCVLLTDHFPAAGLMTAIECGVAAVLPRRGTSDTELVRTVLAVRGGAARLPPALVGTLLTQLDRMRREVLEPNGLTMSGLTARERDVLRLLAEGLAIEEIATELAYSERTVKNVLYGLMTRHGLNTRAHAVAYALRAGVI
jgi:DNA-binding NarL/FixJ family response regulator